MESILILILGWFLGLMSPSITNYIQDFKKAEKIKKSIISEIEEFQINMANVVYIIESKYISINQELFDFLINIYENYNGINNYQHRLTRLKKLKNMSNEELEQIAKSELYKNFDKSLSFKKYDLPYLRSKINDLSLLDENTESTLLQLIFKLNLFNSEIEESKFHYRLTFNSDITDENHIINKEIMKEKQLVILNQSRQIITLIQQLKKQV